MVSFSLKPLCRFDCLSLAHRSCFSKLLTDLFLT
jgi:hypothetical protein